MSIDSAMYSPQTIRLADQLSNLYQWPDVCCPGASLQKAFWSNLEDVPASVTPFVLRMLEKAQGGRGVVEAVRAQKKQNLDGKRFTSLGLDHKAMQNLLERIQSLVTSVEGKITASTGKPPQVLDEEGLSQGGYDATLMRDLSRLYPQPKGKEVQIAAAFNSNLDNLEKLGKVVESYVVKILKISRGHQGVLEAIEGAVSLHEKQVEWSGENT